MPYENTNQQLTNEQRRDFLKALGVGGAVAAGSVSLDQVRNAVSATGSAELAQIGQDIRADLSGSLDAGLLASGQAALAEEVTALPTVVEKGFPTDAPREEFGAVAAAGRPMYDHLGDVGFFESTSEHLPEFTPAYLEESVETFAGSELLAEPLEQLGFDGAAGVDLLGTVVANGEALSGYHWATDEQIPRDQIEFGDAIPPMTQAAAGGVLLWLEDLDQHVWQKRTLLTDQILQDAVWHAQSMGVGFQLMAEGAKAIGAESTEIGDGELGALLTTGFAVQAISQNLLPQDAYWVTEEMAAERRTDLKPVTE